MNTKILVAEDDEAYRSLLRIYLKQAGYSVISAQNGMAALELARKEDPAIVLTDLMMPALDGIGLLRKLRVEKPGTSVILLTGYGTIEKAVDAMRCGAYDFLVKPVTKTKLLDAIARCVRSLRIGETGVSEPGAPHNVYPPPYLEETHEEKEFERLLEKHGITRQERNIIQLILEGKSDKEIGDSLYISYHTVKKHARNIYEKMNVKGRVELIVMLK